LAWNNWNLTPINHVRQAEVIVPRRAIQENGKTLNLCIMKTATNPAQYEETPKTRVF
jgi:hypothetical protein